MEETTTTIYDVARVAGVSMATVSRVVNGNTNVKEKTKNKVLAAIKELDYRPNAVARGLASKRTTTVGVVLPTITSSYFAGIARGVDDIASMYNYNVILSNSDSDEEKELKIIESLLSKQVDGIVFLGTGLSPKVREALAGTKTPVILAGTIDAERELASVNINYTKAAYECTDLLLKRHKKVAYVLGSLDDAENADRIAGYKQALEDNKIKFAKNLVFEGNYSYENGKGLVDKIIASKAEAAIVASDNTAVGLLNALLEKGIKLPDDFEIISGSNSPITMYTNPSMSSIYQPLYDMGAVAMRLLTKLMLKEEVDEEQLILDYEFIKRHTTK
ncbi:catabolite control protein A [Lactococcus termiticola]|uniref:Catabolite control protein A n=1 Tax=Lactococcus termiticola TaxID=2169526 RepID=A0A2R5HGD9_9LACT|nr:catabolite control protein A [Lactococcus termiticola]GBG97133.1 catabolite control protein A [Lactococcus termiticola]